MTQFQINPYDIVENKKTLKVTIDTFNSYKDDVNLYYVILV